MTITVVFRKGRRNCARMQGYADRPGMRAGQLNRRRAHNLVQGRLCGPIADPPAKAIVLNRSNPRRQNAKNARTVPRQQPVRMSQHQGRPNGIQRKLCRHRVRRKLADCFFRPLPGNFQCTRSDNHAIKRATPANMARHTVRICNIQPIIAARNAHYFCALGCVTLAQGNANSARRPNDQNLHHDPPN